MIHIVRFSCIFQNVKEMVNLINWSAYCYSFDVRGRSFTKALYWSDTNSFGPRAYFVTVSRPAALTVENIQLDDGGVSKILITL